MLSIQPTLIPMWLRWLVPLRAPIREAADQALNKKAKIDSLHEINMEADLKQLGIQERARVDAYYRSKVPGLARYSTGTADSSNQDSWVCDNMTINSGRSMLPELLLIALLGVGAWYFLLKEDKPESPATQPAPVELDVTANRRFKVEIVDKDGNVIDVPLYKPQEAAPGG